MKEKIGTILLVLSLAIGVGLLLYPTASNWWNQRQQNDAIAGYRKTGTGMLGYLEIPQIDIFLPIYQGTDESVLQKAVGHMEGTSFPGGGNSTHCVLAAHRGLPSATLFRDLDQLEMGDVFTIHVLDEVFTYEVDQIVVVEPDETEYLAFEEGKDYCTLLTCTPYGINTHRLLVRGQRVDK